MNIKKILIITHGFYPEQSPRSFRATELVKEFCRQGHDVKVIAPYRQGLEDFLSEFPINFHDMGKIGWRVPQLPGQSGVVNLANRAIRRLLNLLFEYPNIQFLWKVRRALQAETGYDLLVSVAVPYPIHWGTAAARKASHQIAVTWVADCGDPYMGQENDSFRPPFYFAWIEKRFCRKAEYLTVPTEGAIQAFYPEFHEKIRVIPQGFKFEEYRYEIAPSPSGKIIFGYGGMFIPGRRDPAEFMAYLQELEGEFDFEFHIYTTSTQHVLRHIGSFASIKVFAPIERRELMQRFATMDFLVNFSNTGNVQTPSKLIDYAILDKPILSIETGNLDRVNVRNFLLRDYSGAYHIHDKEQYRIENVARKFLALIP